MKYVVFTIVFCCSIVFGNTDFPSIIDFKNYSFQGFLLYHEPGSWIQKLGNSGYNLGYAGFNDSPEIGAFIHMLKQQYAISTAVETGTFIGATTRFLSLHFKEVHTIEASKNTCEDAMQRLYGFNNIHIHYGGSEKVLPELLPNLQDKRILFYLDAHGNEIVHWPLFDELEAISKTHKDNCIIVIDDFGVPNTAIHGCLDPQNQELSHELIENHLHKIFTDYDFHYLIPIAVHHSAKCVVIPKKWADKPYLGRIDILPGQNFYDLPINLSRLQNAGFTLRESHQFFNGYDRGDYVAEIKNDKDLKKIIVLNNTVDPIYLAQFPKAKLALFVLEPLELSNAYYDPCCRVYTWNDDLVDGIKFFKLYYPYLTPMLETIPSFEEKKFCVMVSGSDNDYPERPNELYSERMKMVEFFETKPAGDFDIYGRFWIKRFYRDYKGSIPGDLAGKEKIDVLKNYRFAICFENTKGLNGYITEKIFSCFAAGCVPIYWGAENITNYIPKNCFIDYRDFDSREQLYQFLKSMPKRIYDNYIQQIRIFLESKEARLFSPEHFGDLLYEAINDDGKCSEYAQIIPFTKNNV